MRNKAGIIAGFWLAMSLPSVPLYAASDELEKTHKELEASREKEKKLSQAKSDLENELSDLQARLVTSASAIQKSETDLSDAEEKLRILNQQLKEHEEELKDRRLHMDALVKAALKLAHTPPEALVMMPGDVAQTIKAGRALKMATDAIKAETEMIGLQMAELEKLKKKVASNRDAMAKKQADLDKERTGLEKKLSERKALAQKLGHQQQAEADKIAKLAKKEEDLQGLVATVSREFNLFRGSEEQAEAPSYKGKQRSFARAKGSVRMPVSGELVQKFNASTGRTAKGIVIGARSHARVTAPYDGEVVFAGPFLTYGQLVIIRHSDDFHTLLAGLGEIDTGVGQFLLEGEPIGAMGDGESGSRLYVELRKDNQPVDPAPWIAGLNKKK